MLFLALNNYIEEIHSWMRKNVPMRFHYVIIDRSLLVKFFSQTPCPYPISNSQEIWKERKKMSFWNGALFKKVGMHLCPFATDGWDVWLRLFISYFLFLYRQFLNYDIGIIRKILFGRLSVKHECVCKPFVRWEVDIIWYSNKQHYCQMSCLYLRLNYCLKFDHLKGYWFNFCQFLFNNKVEYYLVVQHCWTNIEVMWMKQAV